MTLFGFVWLLIVAFAFLEKKERMIEVTILSSVFQCSNVISIGSLKVGPQIITSAIFILYMGFVHKCFYKIRIKKMNLSLILWMLALLCSVVLSSLVAGNFSDVILRILQLYIYIVCFFMMIQAGCNLSEEKIYKIIKRITVFMVLFGILQIMITSGFLPRSWLINKLFFNEAMYGDGLENVTYFTRDNYFRILGTYMEPSYFSGLLGVFFYFLNKRKRLKNNYFLLAIISLEIILTFSSTAYGSLLLTFAIYILCSNTPKKIKFLLTGGAIFGYILLYFGMHDILDLVIFSKMQGGSANARRTWNILAQRNFALSPLYGVGYKNSRASSIIYTILAEQGVIGFICFLGLNLSIFKYKSRNENLVAVKYAIIANVIGQIIAVPDIDICTYWMWIYIFGAFLGATNMGENRRLNYEK